MSDYISSLEQEKRDIVVAAASEPVVQTVGHRHGKNSLFVLAYGIVFEYGLREGDTGTVLDR